MFIKYNENANYEGSSWVRLPLLEKVNLLRLLFFFSIEKQSAKTIIMSDLDSLINSKISLISHQDARYDGTLFSINTTDSSIVLKDGNLFETTTLIIFDIFQRNFFPK